MDKYGFYNGKPATMSQCKTLFTKMMLGIVQDRENPRMGRIFLDFAERHCSMPHLQKQFRDSIVPFDQQDPVNTDSKDSLTKTWQ